MMNNLKKGFSIVEVFIAFFILTAGILVVYSTTHFPLRQTAAVNYKITAFYLAQEGIDIVRNIRDNNFQEGKNWLEGIPSNSCFSLDYRSDIIEEINDCEPVVLYFHSDEGYSHDDEEGSETMFKRIIETNENNGELNITSTVFWGDGEYDKIIIYKDLHEYR